MAIPQPQSPEDLRSKIRGTTSELEKRVSESLTRFDAAVRALKVDSLHIGDKRGIEGEEGLEDVEDLANRIAARSDCEALEATPRCRPWDYKDFTRRLRTFTPLNWFAKPHCASPPMCARFGWVNKARDALACECCAAELLYAVDTQESEVEAIDNDDDPKGAQPVPFAVRLSTEHHDLCPWKGNSCPKEFLQLPPLAGEDWRRDFVSRLESLVPIMSAHSLPEASLPNDFLRHCPGGFNALANKARTLASEETSGPANAAGNRPSAVMQVDSSAKTRNSNDPLSDISTAAGADGTSSKRRRGEDGRKGSGICRRLRAFPDEAVEIAAAIAVFGWRSASAPSTTPEAVKKNNARDGEELPTVACDGKHRLWCTLCNRRVLTDNFLGVEIRPNDSSGIAARGETASESSPPTAGTGDGRSTKRRRLSGGGTPLKAMDLAGEHRSFCPWARVHLLRDLCQFCFQESLMKASDGILDRRKNDLSAGSQRGGWEAWFLAKELRGPLPTLELCDIDILGEASEEGLVPGWRQALKAVVSWEDSSVQTTVGRRGGDGERFDDAAGDKAKEALDKVQRVLSVLMRY